MDMTTLLVTGSTILLIVSKIPDFITTWQGISRTKIPEWNKIQLLDGCLNNGD